MRSLPSGCEETDPETTFPDAPFWRSPPAKCRAAEGRRVAGWGGGSLGAGVGSWAL